MQRTEDKGEKKKKRSVRRLLLITFAVQYAVRYWF